MESNAVPWQPGPPKIPNSELQAEPESHYPSLTLSKRGGGSRDGRWCCGLSAPSPAENMFSFVSLFHSFIQQMFTKSLLPVCMWGFFFLLNFFRVSDT